MMKIFLVMCVIAVKGGRWCYDAIAKVNNLIIVTANIHDYQSFSELVLENWFEPK